ncbi:MAG: amidohydrolase family protein, partial [Spirochaetales bacterium]
MTTLIKNALISDGTERPLYRSDLVFEGSNIKDIGHFESADKIIDADGLILCPGFMDMHAHSDLEILRNPSMNHKLGQGITFDVSGNCGVGVFPRPIDGPPSFFDILGRYDNWDWTDYPSYLERVHSPFNIVFLQNHAMLRMSAIKGNPNRKATAEEVKTMCNLLEKSLDQGCIGLSSGLYYAPNMYADEEEILALLRVVKKHNKMFCVHHRCEGDFILESVDEVLTYAQKTGVKLEISHLKAIGTKNQCKMDQVLEKIHNARENGVDVL